MALLRGSATPSGREYAVGDARDEGDSGDVIGDSRGRSPSDPGDVANKGYRSNQCRNPIAPDWAILALMTVETPATLQPPGSQLQ